VLARRLDHGYIDEHNIASRFVSGELTGDELDQFKRHYVDCAECMDRVALAQIFRLEAVAAKLVEKRLAPPRARLGVFNVLGTFTPKQQTLIFALSTLALLIIPTVALTWLEQHRIESARPQPEPVIWLPPSGTAAIEARIPTNANWISISTQVPDEKGIYRLSIVDIADRAILVGPDQSASSGTAIGLRVPSLPAYVTFAIVEKKGSNGAYSLVSRHPLMVEWR
jgi:hypothetical protein